MNTKHTILAMGIMMLAATTAHAQEEIQNVHVTNLNIENTGTNLVVKMDLDLGELNVKSNRIRTIRPQLINGTDTLSLKAVGLYGRRRYYYTLRNGNKNPLDNTDIQLRQNKKPQTLEYTDVVPFQPWMEGADLYINNKVYGCVSCLLAENLIGGLYQIPVPEPEVEVYKPKFIYVRPEAEVVKMRQLAATAYVNFRVSRTEVDPTYMNNREELNKIVSTIDAIKAGNKVTSITLKGFASPESPYKNNERLAKGRVIAISNYLAMHQEIPAELITTDYVPENWEGLRKYVEECSEQVLPHKAKILAYIDSDREPDRKEAAIKYTYKDEYKYLLENCYPSLRRTDYAINYEVKHYTDVEEIKRVFRTAPQNLSLEEFYVVAQEYRPGSDEFNEVFQTAVRLFPNDPIANLNAASACMEHGDLYKAELYLPKAGDSTEAQQLRDIYAKLKEQEEKK